MQETCPTLDASCGRLRGCSEQDAGHGHLVVQSVALRGREGGATAELGGEQAYALRASEGGGSDPYVLAPMAFVQNSRSEVRIVGGDGQITGALASDAGAQQQCYIAFSSKDYGADASDDLAPTMRAMGHTESHANGGGQIAVCVTGSVTHTLKAEGFDASEDGTGRGQPIVPHIAHAFDARQSNVIQYGDASGPLDTNGWTSGVQVHMAVRRLMPSECAKLQGFAPDHARIPWKGRSAEQCPDGPQYKAYGNSMATKVMRWIGRRIERNLVLQPVFDELIG